MKESTPPLLVFNCHEAWVHQLEYLGFPLEIIDGLPGRYCLEWDQGVRPLPRNSTPVRLDHVLQSRRSYHCIIAHNITDLLDSKTLPGPRILVMHNTLDSRIRQHGLDMTPDQLKNLVQQFIDWVGGHAVAISRLKARSWGVTDDLVECGVDVRQYPPWSGEIAAGLRISNQVQIRKEILLWDFHQAAFQGVDLRLVGFNPEMTGVFPSRNWEDLKLLLSSHRFYVHTAHPELEDGYNMATLEAMAAGLPVLGNRHPSSPVEHGISGFLADDPRELNHYARLLLQNRELAGRMGEAARKKVGECFPLEKFARQFRRSIMKALEKWPNRKAPGAYFLPAESTPEEKLELLVRSGGFLHLGEAFHDRMKRGEIAGAITALDEMMALLAFRTEMKMDTIEGLLEIAMEVSSQLRKIGDHQAASLLLKAMLETVRA